MLVGVTLLAGPKRDGKLQGKPMYTTPCLMSGRKRGGNRKVGIRHSTHLLAASRPEIVFHTKDGNVLFPHSL